MISLINTHYKQQIINGLGEIGIDDNSTVGVRSKSIPFFKQADLKDCLVEVRGNAVFRKYTKYGFVLIGLDSVSISCWSDDGEIEIDDSSFNEIEESLKINIW